MLLEISFTEINRLLAVNGLGWLQLSGAGGSLFASGFGARLKLQQADSKTNQIILSHIGDNFLGNIVSSLASFGKGRLPPFVDIDFNHITIYWNKLLPQITIAKSRISVRGSTLQVDLVL